MNIFKLSTLTIKFLTWTQNIHDNDMFYCKGKDYWMDIYGKTYSWQELFEYFLSTIEKHELSDNGLDGLVDESYELFKEDFEYMFENADESENEHHFENLWNNILMSSTVDAEKEFKEIKKKYTE